MNRRLFFKALVLTIASFSFKIFPSINKEPISFDYGEVQFKYVSTVKSKEYEVLEPDVFRVVHNKPYS